MRLFRRRHAPAPAPHIESRLLPWLGGSGSAIAPGHHVWAGSVDAAPGLRRMLRTPASSAAAIVGPPRSGKTRSVFAPTIASWAGPVIATSTKGDVLATAAARARRGGPVYVYDPTGSLEGAPSIGFSPLSRCGSWDGAVEVAAALLAPASADTAKHADHFSVAARGALAPLVHAAALASADMGQVRSWVARRDLREPSRILAEHGATTAIDELADVAAQAQGDYSTSVYGTVQVALAWVSRSAVALSTDPRRTAQLDVDELFAGSGTLYVVSPSRTQEELGPLVAALIDALVARAITRAVRSPDGRLDPPLLLALDEAANIAPLRGLPRLCSEGIQQGLVPVIGVQDWSQVRSRWGEHDAATLWSTPALRLILAGLSDPFTQQLVSEAGGEERVWLEQRGETLGTSHQVDAAGRTLSDGDSRGMSQQYRPAIERAALRSMAHGTAWAFPQGLEALPVTLFAGGPGMEDGDWRQSLTAPPPPALRRVA